MSFRLARLPETRIAKADGTPTDNFKRWWQTAVKKIEDIVSQIVEILVSIGVAQETADGALELAEGAINAGTYTIKTDKVLTDSVAASSITKTTTFFNDYGLWAVAPGSFVDISNGDFTAQVAVVTTAYPEQGVAIDVLIAMNRNGASDDNVTVQCIRTSDSLVLDQVYEYDVQGQNFTYAAKFYDPDPADSITETYKLQVNSDDATKIKEVYMSGFLTLR